ncbi:MAG TPA: BTAD domain-containing putative transcriptional regulator [Actinocrinis sp.]|nr:BTAD domain-containing putative transcriptional regulator [Actinocrinis sp.]
MSLLGPVRMISGDGSAVGLGPPMQRCVLALLVVQAGRPVPVEHLVDALWGEAAPQGSRRMVQWYVSRLRRVLEPYGFGLTREGGGYRLDAACAQVDVHEFRRLVAVAGAPGSVAGQADAAESEAETLRRALALWHGRPLTGLPDSEALDGLRAGLAEERLQAEERLYAAEIAAGNHARVMAALAATTQDNPLRERLVVLRMRALCQAGCPAEALACYEAMRRRLAAEFGVDPSAELRAEHLAILRADRSAREEWDQDQSEYLAWNMANDTGFGRRASAASGLDVVFDFGLDLAPEDDAGPEPDGDPPDLDGTGRGPARSTARLRERGQNPESLVARFQLPRRIPDFTGRDDELARLVARAAPEPDPTAATVSVCSIDGMAGAGKTALAVEAAHAVADRFPDGQFYVELHTHTAGAEPVTTSAALEFGLRCLGIAAWHIPSSSAERAALWRSSLAGQRVLIVLDDVAGAEQIHPLMPPGSGSLAVVTSRRRLVDLDAAELVSLDVLAPPEAAELFTRMVGLRAEADPGAVRAVLEACGYLPLALRIAAARLRHRPQWTVSFLARQLEQDPLGVLTTADRGVANAFTQSYQRLDDRGRRALRVLGLHAAVDFDVPSAVALTGDPEVEFVLESLVDNHLLTQQAPGRYAFHRLVRLCASAHAAEDWTARPCTQTDLPIHLPCTNYDN